LGLFSNSPTRLPVILQEIERDYDQAACWRKRSSPCGCRCRVAGADAWRKVRRTRACFESADSSWTRWRPRWSQTGTVGQRTPTTYRRASPVGRNARALRAGGSSRIWQFHCLTSVRSTWARARGSQSRMPGTPSSSVLEAARTQGPSAGLPPAPRTAVIRGGPPRSRARSRSRESGGPSASPRPRSPR
jgi:hypothetical protein